LVALAVLLLFAPGSFSSSIACFHFMGLTHLPGLITLAVGFISLLLGFGEQDQNRFSLESFFAWVLHRRGVW
jgi:hypothetical protein